MRIAPPGRTLPLPILGAVLLICALASAQRPPSRRVDYDRDIAPILKAHCYVCHGAASAQGGLRVDTPELLLRGGVSGPAVVPRNRAKSLLLSRLTGHDGKPRMPLGFTPLTDARIARIGAWIDQGAVRSGKPAPVHWAFAPLRRPTIPVVRQRAWVRNPIDAFVLARLEKAGLHPSPPADRVTLLRRVTFDLTGLPPTPEAVDAFVADRSPDAYEKAVDRLLASPHYGERMAFPWLDAARYADSNGFQQDGDTYQYVWRDWVVRVLNADLPFDRFTYLQMAGDLMPEAGPQEQLATGFHRCHLLNGEGGAIPEEQRNVILFDRVDVTATTWLGLTLSCAQCHDHKYDPITQRDYYSFLAYFNQVPESGVPPGGGQYRIAEPAITMGSDEEMAKLRRLEAEVKTARADEDAYRETESAALATAQRAWEDERRRDTDVRPQWSEWYTVGPFVADTFDAAFDRVFPPEIGVDLTTAYEDGKLPWKARPEWTDGRSYALTGERSAFYLYRTVRTGRPRSVILFLGSDDGIKVWLNGKPVLSNRVTRGVAPDQEKVAVDLAAGENHVLLKIVNGGGPGGFHFRSLDQGVPDDILALIRTPETERTPESSAKLRRYFLENHPPDELKARRQRTRNAEQVRNDFVKTLPRVMILSDAQPRKTRILQRGNYEMPGEEVTPAPPAFLPAPPDGTPKDRRGLAAWLLDARNPLTARVQVNRYWQLFFGQGLAKTSENLGLRGEPPTHPELLDWLAVTFRQPGGASPYDCGWSIKRLVRLIVTSATYRQSSRTTPLLRRRDPENRLLARGARFRLPAAFLRDSALATSGLLDARLGGKPVYPYQPKGIWDGLAITNERDFTYPQSGGADLYRRSLYTFQRRTVAPANMFDASVRNTCQVRPSLTNTPLHALTTLNDTTWTEASRALAERTLHGRAVATDARLAEIFRRVCGRRPHRTELAILRRCLERSRTAFRADPKTADAFLSIGDSPRDRSLDPVEHAAYASVCLAVYNLDEALTRE
ncbi:MAG: PSD1 and planctomycete cytochrome C domain-containing protein [Capsulimonadales bacterium]|nr:PSD1 and planctomycete cytochrome C domain-containing protein [Capsulimonadales bacterium]